MTQNCFLAQNDPTNFFGLKWPKKYFWPNMTQKSFFGSKWPKKIFQPKMTQNFFQPKMTHLYFLVFLVFLVFTFLVTLAFLVPLAFSVTDPVNHKHFYSLWQFFHLFFVTTTFFVTRSIWHFYSLLLFGYFNINFLFYNTWQIHKCIFSKYWPKAFWKIVWPYYKKIKDQERYKWT